VAAEEPDAYASGVTGPLSPPTAREPAAPAADPGGEYRRLSDLAREARLGQPAPPGARPRANAYASGEPFAPHGPYGSYGRQDQSPYHYQTYDLEDHAPAATPAPRRPRSFIGLLTICLALIVGGIMVAAQPTAASTSTSLSLAGGAVLVTIGAGLLIATWFGRGAGLVATGTIVALVLIAGTTLNGIPTRIGSYTWEPLDATHSSRVYAIGIGDGTLNLSDTRVAAGSRTRFDASVSIGQLKVIVPPTARVEVFASSRIGDIKIDQSVRSGPDVQYERILEPEIAGATPAPTFELHLKAGLGDVEVRRAA
jgi:hypothetical protein